MAVGLKKIVARLSAIVAIAACAIVAVLTYDFMQFQQRPLHVDSDETTLVVSSGMSFKRIVQALSDRGMIDRPHYLTAWARWTGHASRIQAGEYAIPAGLLPMQLLERMAQGRVVQHTLTVVEGWSMAQMLDAMRAHDKIRPTLPSLDSATVMAALGLPAEHPEGRFYPDTYHFPAGTTDVAFLRRAYDTMAKLLAAEWEARDPQTPLKTPYEALILASIIEKETGLPEERAQIAGVFVRRLQRGMRLQTDPTVIYGMGSRFDGNLRRADLRNDTPYNTYTRKGLPPTPIALPGRDAIHAALHPASGRSLYFVSRGDGSHYFSATLDEHNAAVRRYQLNRK